MLELQKLATNTINRTYAFEPISRNFVRMFGNVASYGDKYRSKITKKLAKAALNRRSRIQKRQERKS